MVKFPHVHKSIGCQLMQQGATGKIFTGIFHKNRCYIFLSLKFIKNYVHYNLKL